MVSLHMFLSDSSCWYLCLTVQHECIPQGILAMDVICQAKSGMGKTAVFVLATLQQIEHVDGQVILSCCNTKRLFAMSCHTVQGGGRKS